MIDVCNFQVIGELKDNPDHLLTMGDDGQCYAHDLEGGEIQPLKPDDSWAVDVTHLPLLRAEMAEDRIAS